MLLMMFVGMAFIKLDVLTAARSYTFYAWMAAAGYMIGVPVNAYACWVNWKAGFEPVTAALAFSTYEPARVAVSLAHIAVLLMICKAGALRWLTARLSAVGQMAFSNYILHSLVCTTIFYGHGAGLYARLERYQLYYFVFAIWLVQLVASKLWLDHFRFGPLEWCWRSLTYWKRQPMRLRLRPEVIELLPVAPVPLTATMGAEDDAGASPPTA
jgi:uncharacterized protein